MTIPQIQLEQIINELREQLMSYAQTPNAKDGYIQRENKLIQSLTEIYNGIHPLKYQDLWIEIERRWEVFERTDANFSGIQLDLRLRPNGLLSYQPFNLFDDEISTNY
jgi:hypothetical protein